MNFWSRSARISTMIDVTNERERETMDRKEPIMKVWLQKDNERPSVTLRIKISYQMLKYERRKV